MNEKVPLLRISALVVFLAYYSGPGVAAETAATPSGRLAERLEGFLAGLEDTIYQHKTEIDEGKGSFRCDCSGLIGYALRRDFPEAYLSLRGEEAPWRTRALSVTYFETFARAGEGRDPSWERVSSLLEARPGDVLAWRKDELRRGESTGHTLMIAGKPERESDGRIKVRVLDSTRSTHANDTRPDGTNGVGAGVMWFQVDEAGHPVGYYVNAEKKLGLSTQVEIGRLKEPDASGASGEAGEDLSFLGLSESRAMEVAKDRGLKSRIIRVEGKAQALKSLSWQADRVNFVIEEGNVARVIRG